MAKCNELVRLANVTPASVAACDSGSHTVTAALREAQTGNKDAVDFLFRWLLTQQQVYVMANSISHLTHRSVLSDNVVGVAGAAFMVRCDNLLDAEHRTELRVRMCSKLAQLRDHILRALYAKKRRPAAVGEGDADDLPDTRAADPAGRYNDREFLSDCEALLADTPRAWRALFGVHVQRLSPQAVADELGVNVTTVYTDRKRAIRYLADRLGDRHDD